MKMLELMSSEENSKRGKPRPVVTWAGWRGGSWLLSAWSRTRWCAASQGRRGRSRRTRQSLRCRAASPPGSGARARSRRGCSRWCSRSLSVRRVSSRHDGHYYLQTWSTTHRSCWQTGGQRRTRRSRVKLCTSRKCIVSASWRCFCRSRWWGRPSWQSSSSCSSSAASEASSHRGSPRPCRDLVSSSRQRPASSSSPASLCSGSIPSPSLCPT